MPPHPRRSLRIRDAAIAICLFLIPLSLLGVHLLLRSEFEKSRTLRETIEQTVTIRNDLAELLILHLDLETGMRGFVLSQDDAFLEPYRTATAARGPVISALKNDLSKDPESQIILNRIQMNSDRKLQFVNRNFTSVRAGRADLAAAQIASGDGRRAMDAIRRDIAALDAIQVRRIDSAVRHGGGGSGDIELIVTLLLVALALLLAGVAWVIGRATRARAQALARSQRLMARQAAMFDGAVDGMLLLDEQGVITRTNPSIVRMFGYSEEELIGRHNTVLIDETIDRELSQAWLAGVKEAGVHGAGRRQEFVGRRKSGEIFDTEVAISRVSDETERRYVAAIRDISAFKRAERMKNEFVSTVSHELRTPLTSIAGSLGLLAGGAVGQLNVKAARLVGIAHSNCERLIRLINDILDIEKIESGKMHFAENDVDVGAMIERTVEANSALASDRDVTLDAQPSDMPIFVRGDADRLEQLLTNLVSNAIKHSPAGAAVEVSSHLRANKVLLEVADRGAGVPPEFRGRIFGKFAMADSSDSRTKGGTGLGLSISREIAQRHGGSIEFEDREGGGTVFRAVLPAYAFKAEPVVPQAGLPTVLHVDDDVDCLSVVASAFENRATLVEIATMDEARRIVATGRFEGAIIDVGMRDELGIELIPLLRARNPEIAVVLFSAIDDRHAEADADAVLIKSRSTIDELVETTMDLIAAARVSAS